MDINDLRGIGTLLVMIAFISICIWAYNPKRKKQFDDAAQLPFSEENENKMNNRFDQEKKPHE